MKNLLENLSQEQKEVVFGNNNRTFVNACPGSGKTHCITAFVVNKIRNDGVLPKKIQILTFTDETAKSMKSRLAQELGEKIANSVCVNTFHSYANKYFLEKNILQDLTMAEEQDLKAISKKAARKIKGLYTAKTFLETARKLEVKSSYIAKKSKDYHLLELYYEYLEKNKLWHFDYLLNKLIAILRSKDERGEYFKVVNSFEYLVVDEYQDCNANQVELLKVLVGKSRKFLFVGDPDQLIYDWRGAKMTYSIDIERHFKDVVIKSLTTNYRSSAEVVNCANNLIKNNIQRIEKNMTSFTGFSGKVCCFDYQHKKPDLLSFYKVCGELKGRSSILCNTNRECEYFFHQLNSRGFKNIELGLSDLDEGLSIITCHSAKGLEFDNVIIPCATDYNFPQKESLRRLFYVAVTRAKKNLYIFSHTSKDANKGYRRQCPSKLLEEMNIKSYHQL